LPLAAWQLHWLGKPVVCLMNLVADALGDYSVTRGPRNRAARPGGQAVSCFSRGIPGKLVKACHFRVSRPLRGLLKVCRGSIVRVCPHYIGLLTGNQQAIAGFRQDFPKF
jgi:hypothetical protein